MQHFFVMSELLVRLIPICALIGSFALRSEQLKLKTLLFSQLLAVVCASGGITLFLLIQTVGKPVPLMLLHGVVRLDFIASLLAGSISVISLIVVWFSERNLLGDKTRVPFIRYLVALSLVASTLVTANDIVLFLVCWHAISILLWRTVKLKKDAFKSARTVLWHHLLSDACFLLAIVLMVVDSHSTEISTIVHDRTSLKSALTIYEWTTPVAKSTLVGLLLLIAMGCKSALFPFHKWLLATVDAPTPLSGLLHAGIVNVSAIMAARLYLVLDQSTSVHVLWLVWSIAAAFIGTLLMSTRSDTKGELVLSTTGQMGFMSLEAGVGAIAAAIFHLIAHGFFKCLLFLQAHSSISEGLLKMRYGHAHGGIGEARSRMHLACVCLLAFPTVVWLCMQESVDSAASLSVLLVMAVVISSVEAFRRIGLVLLLSATATFLAAVVLTGDLSKISSPFMDAAPLHGDWILVASIAAFAILTYALSKVRGTALGKALYVHSLNGFYVDELVDLVKSGVRRLKQICLFKRRSCYGRDKASAKAGC